VKLIYAECDKEVNALDGSGRVPLFYALSCDSFEEMSRIFLFLLAHGADVNADGGGRTVLLSAAAAIPRMPVQVAQMIAQRVGRAELTTARGIAHAAQNYGVLGLIDACLAK
jgi:hypothetical protein